MIKEKHVDSYRGRFVRSLTDLLVRRGLSAETFFNQGIWLASKSLWRPGRHREFKQYQIDHLPIECLSLKDRKETSDHFAILQLHGGGYVIKLNDIYRYTASKYSAMSDGATVFTIDYRVGPDDQFPAALEDALMAWNHLLDQGYKEENIIVTGDSAGGNLATSLVLKLRDEGRKLPKAMVLISPWLDLTASGESYEYNLTKDPIFGVKHPEDDISEGKEILFPYFKGGDLTNPYVSPIYGEFHGFPPMLIQVGSDELLESDSLTLYEKAKAAKVDVTLTRYNGMFHTFQILVPSLPESKVAWDEIEDFIRNQFSLTGKDETLGNEESEEESI